MAINIDPIEVVIDTEDNWYMAINIDSIEVVIDSEGSRKYGNKYRLNAR